MKTLDDLYQEIDALAYDALTLWQSAKDAFGDRPELLDVLINIRNAYDSLDTARDDVDRLRAEEEADQ